MSRSWLVVPLEAPLVRGASDHDHLPHGEIELDRGLLGHHRHPAGRLPGRQGQQVDTVDEHPTGGRGMHPVDGLEQGRFSAPVGAEQSDQLPVAHRQVHSGDDPPAAEVDGDPLQLEAHWVAPYR